MIRASGDLYGAVRILRLGGLSQESGMLPGGGGSEADLYKAVTGHSCQRKGKGTGWEAGQTGTG